MTDILTTTISVSIHRKGDNPVYGVSATKLMIDDISGGGFFVLSQNKGDGEDQKITLDIEEIIVIEGVAKGLYAAYEKACEEGGGN